MPEPTPIFIFGIGNLTKLRTSCSAWGGSSQPVSVVHHVSPLSRSVPYLRDIARAGLQRGQGVLSRECIRHYARLQSRVQHLKSVRENVFAQTYRDFEATVVDDGLKDETRYGASRFTDPRLRCVRHERNRGCSTAYNAGFREAKSELIAILGALRSLRY